MIEHETRPHLSLQQQRTLWDGVARRCMLTRGADGLSYVQPIGDDYMPRKVKRIPWHVRRPAQATLILLALCVVVGLLL